jgi:hypothetical protein
MALGWLAATAATTALAYVAVDAAGSRVTDRPLSAVVATPSTAAAPTSTLVPTPSSTLASPSTTLPHPTTTLSSPATTASPATTTTESWQQQTINSSAGTLVVSFRSDQVRLEAVAPLIGFSYQVEQDGPSEVRVEFEGPLRVEVRVRFRDGQLVTEIDEDD